ncbi:MAG: NUDIX hydrolase [Eubacteriales bacterium]|nr:NUDIX hydrolase [Eubacteriales bacterium]
MLDLQKDLDAFVPCNDQEEQDKEIIQHFIRTNADAFLRSNRMAHMTTAAWVVNKDRSKVLMIHHNVFNSWSWLGGHADGELDLPTVCLEEVEEESGLKNIRLVSRRPISVEVLSVSPHMKHGEYVAGHLHMNVTYLVEADSEEELHHNPEENSAAAWFTPEEALEKSTEPWFVEHIYKKLIEKAKSF